MTIGILQAPVESEVIYKWGRSSGAITNAEVRMQKSEGPGPF